MGEPVRSMSYAKRRASLLAGDGPLPSLRPEVGVPESLLAAAQAAKKVAALNKERVDERKQYLEQVRDAPLNAPPVTIPEAKLSTLLMISVEIPSIRLHTQVTFSVKPSRQQAIYDGTLDLVNSLVDMHQEDFVGLDLDGNLRKLEFMRKRATEEVDAWQAQLKMVQEWKFKVDRAAQQMNRMRDAYYRELFHLREQVYQQKKAEKDGEKFQPSYALLFDPTEYTMEDEVKKLVDEKVTLIRQELDTKMKQLEVKNLAKINLLTDQLQTTKMVLSRKEQLVEKVMAKHGYQGEAEVQEELGSIKNPSKSEAKRQARKISERADKDAEKDVSKQAAQGTESAVFKPWIAFVTRKFGSLKDAKVQLGLKRKMDDQMGLADFKKLADELGYVCEDAKALFLVMSSGESFTPYLSLIEQKIRSPSPESLAPAIRKQGRRMSAPGTSSIRFAAIAETEDSDSWKPKGAAGSEENLPSPSDGSDGGLSESSQGSVKSGSSMSSAQSSMAPPAGEPLVRRGSRAKTLGSADNKALASDIAAKLGVRKVRSVLSQMPKKKKVDAETMTVIAVDCDTSAAYSGAPESVHCFTALRPAEFSKEKGTDAMPYEAAFPKVKKYSRSVQSQIDGRMLDKAIDFYDKAAESNWNELAGLMESGWTSDEESPKTAAPKKKVQSEEEEEDDLPSLPNPPSALAKVLANRAQGSHLQGRTGNRVMTFGDYNFKPKLPYKALTQALESDAESDGESGNSPMGAEIERKQPRSSTWSLGGGLFAGARPAVSLEVLKAPLGIVLPSSIQISGANAANSGKRGLSRGLGRNMKVQGTQTTEGFDMTRRNNDGFLDDCEWVEGGSGTDQQQLQIQQVLKMAQQIQERLPQLKQRATKLALQAGDSEQIKLLEELQKSLMSLSYPQVSAGKKGGLRRAHTHDDEGPTVIEYGVASSGSSESPTSGYRRTGSATESEGRRSPDKRAAREAARLKGDCGTISALDAAWQNGRGYRGGRLRSKRDGSPSTRRRDRRSRPSSTVPAGGSESEDSELNSEDEKWIANLQQKSVTAQKASSKDDTKRMAEKARRKSTTTPGSEEKCDAAARNDAEQKTADLRPGWSGVGKDTQQGFESRGVPKHVLLDAPALPPEQSVSISPRSRGNKILISMFSSEEDDGGIPLMSSASIPLRPSPSIRHAAKPGFKKSGSFTRPSSTGGRSSLEAAGDQSPGNAGVVDEPTCDFQGEDPFYLSVDGPQEAQPKSSESVGRKSKSSVAETSPRPTKITLPEGVGALRIPVPQTIQKAKEFVGFSGTSVGFSNIAPAAQVLHVESPSAKFQKPLLTTGRASPSSGSRDQAAGWRDQAQASRSEAAKILLGEIPHRAGSPTQQVTTPRIPNSTSHRRKSAGQLQGGFTVDSIEVDELPTQSASIPGGGSKASSFTPKSYGSFGPQANPGSKQLPNLALYINSSKESSEAPGRPATSNSGVFSPINSDPLTKSASFSPRQEFDPRMQVRLPKDPRPLKATGAGPSRPNKRPTL